MSIKSIITSFLCLFIIAVSTGGCKKVCKVCDYGTFCNNGYCFCPNGFEGDSCTTYSATKFINRSYYVSDPCSNNGSGYSVFITVDNTNYPNRLSVNGLFNLGQAVEMDIYSNASKQGVDIGIPDQNLGAAEVSGTGIYQNVNGFAKITINCDYTSGGYDRQCTLILTQQ